MLDDDFNFFFDKKKRKHFFFDMFDEFERMDKLIDELFEKNLRDLEKIKPGKHYVYGFSVKIGPDGKPVVEEFGNFRPEEKKLEVRDEREPVTDFIDHGNSISVISELPGVEEKDIHIKYAGDSLEIKVPGKFYKKMKVPKLDKKSIKWRFKNGVIEVNAKKA